MTETSPDPERVSVLAALDRDRHWLEATERYGLVWATQPDEPSAKYLVLTQVAQALIDGGDVVAVREPGRPQPPDTFLRLTPQGRLALAGLTAKQAELLHRVRDSESSVDAARDLAELDCLTVAEVLVPRELSLSVFSAGWVTGTVGGGAMLTQRGREVLELAAGPDGLAPLLEDGRSSVQLPPLDTQGMRFLEVVGGGSVVMDVSRLTWRVDLSPTEASEIEERHRESRFPGLTEARYDVGGYKTWSLGLTKLGEDAVATWRTVLAEAALAEAHKPRAAEVDSVYVQRNSSQDREVPGIPYPGEPESRPTADDDASAGGWPVEYDFTDSAGHYAQLAEAAARALALSGVVPRSGGLTYSHAALVEGLRLLPRGKRAARRVRVVGGA